MRRWRQGPTERSGARSGAKQGVGGANHHGCRRESTPVLASDAGGVKARALRGFVFEDFFRSEKHD